MTQVRTSSQRAGALPAAMILALAFASVTHGASSPSAEQLAATAGPGDVIKIEAGRATLITAAELDAAGAEAGYRIEGFEASGDAKVPGPSRTPSKEQNLAIQRPGLVTPQSTIGTADYKLVSDANLKVSPWRQVGLLEGSRADCSAFMVYRNVIATAAHCLLDKGLTNGSIKFSPGASSSYKPYGTCQESARFLPAYWIQNSNNNEEYDYAAVRLNCTIGTTVGWLTTVGWGAVNTGGYSLRVAGYPGTNQSMYYSDDIVRTDPRTWYIRYKNDTDVGSSGGPAMHHFSSTVNGCVGWCPFAIHTQGAIYASGTTRYCTTVTSGECNQGRKIDTVVVNMFVSAR